MQSQLQLNINVKPHGLWRPTAPTANLWMVNILQHIAYDVQ